ncbi:MAG: molecular chaperone HtpG [Clostridia bacterium]|nr:molecular chaperone HtpG [Clostridia bacterium]
MAKGNISVNSENIFPIIKKWLYSDKDIFLRELVSNGCDAITKLKKLSNIGEAKIGEDEKLRVDVIVDKEAKTITISDNGIGMTEEEIDKYITQIAFSGASDFLEKYKEENEKDGGIIGHFGLGFYSAFMPSTSVLIDSLSYKDGAKPAKWFCDGSMEYEMSEGERKERGTTITLFIAEDSKEFLEEFTLRQILNKYCSFLPVEVYLAVANNEENKENEEEQKPINDINPLWAKSPRDCTDEEYKEFYTKVFMDFNEPLFWIHLNVDFPFNLKGILYFPKLNHEFATNEGQIKLYNNQVFVADNVKEVIPEFLMLLKGTIDCPDLPLNVSRSFLQNDGYVKKISAHITKKVADKLCELFKKEREKFNTYWEDINMFIKYGCIRDEKFYDKVKDIMLYKDVDGNYITLTDYIGDKEDKTIYYVSNEAQQAQYVKMLKEQGINSVLLPAMIDSHFISFIESKENGVKFMRVDAKISDELTNGEEISEEKSNSIIEKFKKNLNDDALKISVKAFRDANIPAIMTLSEESRRMQEIYKSYGQQFAGMSGMFNDDYTLVLNTENGLIKKIDTMDEDMQKLVCEHIYDLAMLCNKPLGAESMTKFVERNNTILQKLI